MGARGLSCQNKNNDPFYHDDWVPPENNLQTASTTTTVVAANHVKTARLMSQNPRNIFPRNSPLLDLAPFSPKNAPKHPLENLRDAYCQTPETCVDTGMQTEAILTNNSNSAAPTFTSGNDKQSENEESVKSEVTRKNSSEMVVFNHLGVI